MKVIVTGGRNYSNKDKVAQVLRALDPTTVIHGNASGADSLAKDWANRNDVEQCSYDANWKELGLKAGPIRNTLMLDHNVTAVVIAFPGGKGTQDCVNKAIKRNMLVLRVEE